PQGGSSRWTPPPERPSEPPDTWEDHHVPRRPEVIVRRSRFWATNTTIVTASAGCLLVDPGVYPDELRATAGRLAGPVLAAVHTHAHWDHLLWTPELGDAVPRFVTRGTRTGLD